jgi:hypothetical protein
VIVPKDKNFVALLWRIAFGDLDPLYHEHAIRADIGAFTLDNRGHRSL